MAAEQKDALKPQPDFRMTGLDPGLLSAPFRVQTNWRVIAGAPCSGKSTLIQQLANRGFQTVPECARIYIERVIAGGQVSHPIRVDAAELQRGIKDMQLGVENSLRPEDILFLDAAVPSSLAWFRAYGMDPNEMLPDCFRHRYASVFILEPLPFHSDIARVEEVVAIAGFLDEWQIRDYLSLGYHPVRVPVLPPEERLAFVLERLSEQGFLEKK
jgi:predicted ATPase